jgi:hypothetical protein
MIRSLMFAATLACVAVPVLAQPTRDPREVPCLRQRNIYDYQIVPGNRSLVVTDLSRRRYRLNFMGRCYNLQHQFGLAFKSHGVGTLSCIERGDEILMNDPVGPNQCIIQSVEVQSRDLDQADRDAMRDQQDRRDDRRRNY